MYRWKLAGRCGALFSITVMLITPTVSYQLPPETNAWPQEPECTEGVENATICACDPLCAQYGDCCRSSPYFVPEEQRLGASLFTCERLDYKKLYAVTRCPPDWKDSDTRNRCEHPDRSYRDPLLDVPVTSMSTNITYHNWHCAYCHGDLHAATSVIWSITFVCPGRDLHTSGSYETLAEYLSFDALTSFWTLNVSVPTAYMSSSWSAPGYTQHSKDNNTREIQLHCFPEITAPIMKIPERFCHFGTIDRCSKSWEDNEVKNQCEAYTARVCSGYDLYRNRHCLLCNNIVVPEKCSQYERHYTTRFPTFSMLLDWRRLQKGECASSEIYDPISKVCRKVFV